MSMFFQIFIITLSMLGMAYYMYKVGQDIKRASHRALDNVIKEGLGENDANNEADDMDEDNPQERRSTWLQHQIQSSLSDYETVCDWIKMKLNIAKDDCNQMSIAFEFRERCCQIMDCGDEDCESCSLVDWEKVCGLEDKLLIKYKLLRGLMLSYCDDRDDIKKVWEAIKAIISEMRSYLAYLTKSAYEEEARENNETGSNVIRINMSHQAKRYSSSDKERVKRKEREIFLQSYVVPDNAKIDSLPEIMQNLSYIVESAYMEIDPESVRLGRDIINLYVLWQKIIDEHLTDEYLDTGSVIVGLARNFFEVYRSEIKYRTKSSELVPTSIYKSVCAEQIRDVREQFAEAENVVANLAKLSAKRMNLGHDDEKLDAMTWNTVLNNQLGAENSDGELLSSSGIA